MYLRNIEKVEFIDSSHRHNLIKEDIKMLKTGDWVKVLTPEKYHIWIELYKINGIYLEGRIDEWTTNNEKHGYNNNEDVKIELKNIFEIYQNYKG